MGWKYGKRMYNVKAIREWINEAHYREEGYVQRIRTKMWTTMLLAGVDTLFVNGRQRQLVGKSIGPGVYEIKKKPLEE